MTPHVRIRPAEPRDADAFCALAAALNRDQGDPDDLLTAHVVEEELILGGAAALSMVAEAPDGALVGYATAHRTYETGHAERGLYVADLYVDPAHRRRGVARALMAALAAAGRARFGTRHLWWTAKPHNTAAHAFYRRLGGRGEAVMAFACVHDEFDRLAHEGTVP